GCSTGIHQRAPRRATVRSPDSAATSGGLTIASKWQIGRVANLNYPPRVEAFRPAPWREVAMKAIQRIVAAAAFAFVLPAPADAATTDPEVVIYRFPGVRDDGGAANVGVATVFHCTNFSGVPENIRFVTRNSGGTLKNNDVFSIGHLSTTTMATHVVTAYVNAGLNTGLVGQGTTAIAATSINVICTAMTIEAAATNPIGVALRGIRFNPIPGSQE